MFIEYVKTEVTNIPGRYFRENIYYNVLDIYVNLGKMKSGGWTTQEISHRERR